MDKAKLTELENNVHRALRDYCTALEQRFPDAYAIVEHTTRVQQALTRLDAYAEHIGIAEQHSHPDPDRW